MALRISSPYLIVGISDGGGVCKTVKISVADWTNISSVVIFGNLTAVGKNWTVSASRTALVDGR